MEAVGCTIGITSEVRSIQNFAIHYPLSQAAKMGTKSAQEEPTTVTGTSDPARSSFAAGTMVKTPNGYKPIEEISEGDTVYSRNPVTGEESQNRVLKKFSHTVSEIYRIHYNDGTILEATGNHRVFVNENEAVPVKDLHSGQRTLTEKEDRDIPIERLGRITLEEPIVVYNFEVENDHTYFVTENDVWVHNEAEAALYAEIEREAEKKEIEEAFGEGAYDRYVKGKRAALPFIGEAIVQHFKEIPLDIIDLLRPRGPITGGLIHGAIEQQKADYYKKRSVEISEIIKDNNYDPAFTIGIIKQADENEFLGRLLGFVSEGLLGFAIEASIQKALSFIVRSRVISLSTDKSIIEAVLRAEGDDLLRAFSVQSMGGLRDLSPKQIERLVSKASNGLRLNKPVSDLKLWDLSLQTKVEWAYIDNGAEKILYSGGPDAVKIKITSNTKKIVHTHLTDPTPSLDDFEVLLDAKKLNPAIDKLDMVGTNGSKPWSFNELSEMAKQGKLKRAKKLRM